MAGVYETEKSVDFCDVDTRNRLSMKGAMRLMQEAANLHSDQAGHGINQIRESGLGWVLYQQRCRLFERPCWNTRLIVRTWSRGRDGVFCLRDFQLCAEGGQKVAEGTSSWLLIDISAGRMVRPDEDLLMSYGIHDEKLFDEPLRPIKPLSGAPKLWEYSVQKRDIDINQHVHNLCYLDYAMEVLPEGVQTADFSDVEIQYRKASYQGEALGCYGEWESENSYLVMIRDEESNALHTVVRMKIQ